MDTKYEIKFNKENKIEWISVITDAGKKVIKIKDTKDNNKYMEQLSEINNTYGNFWSSFVNNDYKTVRKNMAKERQRIATKKFKEEKRKNPISKKISNWSLKKKVTATALSAMLVLSLIPLASCAKNKINNKANTKTTTEQSIDISLIQNEDNPELKTIYEEILKYENGEAYVKYLMEIDKTQEAWNTRLANFPDGKNNKLQLKAEEWAAAHAVANGTNLEVPSLLDADLVLCLYLQWAQYAAESVFVSNQTSGIESVIVDGEVKNAYTSVAKDIVQPVLDGEKVSSVEQLTKLYKVYPEAPSLTGYDGTLTIMAQMGIITPNQLEEFQEGVKGNDVLNEVILKIKAKQETEENQMEILELCQKAFLVMDKKNIKATLYEREDFDISTTENYQKMFPETGIIIKNGDGSYTKVTVKNGKVTREKMTEEEATKKYGKDAVDKAKDKADKTDKIVDTDGDGKADSTIDEAEKESERQKEEVEDKAAKIATARAKGESDGKAGKANSNPYASGTDEYAAYNRGWNSGHRQYLASQEEPEIIEETVEYHNDAPESAPETTNETETQTKRQKVVEIKNYETTNENNIEITMEDETSYSSSYVRTRA